MELHPPPWSRLFFRPATRFWGTNETLEHRHSRLEVGIPAAARTVPLGRFRECSPIFFGGDCPDEPAHGVQAMGKAKLFLSSGWPLVTFYANKQKPPRPIAQRT